MIASAEQETPDASALIEVRPAGGKGRGVFAKRPIPVDARIECAAGLFFDAIQSRDLKPTATFDHLLANPTGYAPDSPSNTYALILGMMSCCNHATDHNAIIDWDFLPDGLWLTLRSLRAIPEGAEVTIKYTNLEEYPAGGMFERQEESGQC